MIYLITNRTLVSNERYYDVIKEASFNGVNKIILREKDLDNESLENIYLKLKSLVSVKSNIIINSNIDVAKKVNAYGIHLPFQKFLEYKKDRNWVVGVSVHSVEEGIEAFKRGVDYLIISNIFETKCKEGLKGKGINIVYTLKEKVTIPVIALGGINSSNKDEVYKSGADGIAIMSGIMESVDVKNTVENLRRL